MRKDCLFNPQSHKYRNFPGDKEPALTANQEFWSASDSGKGTQELRWGLEEGRYSLVLMNKNHSKGIDVNGKIGVKVPSLQWIGIGLMVGGFILIILSFLFTCGAIATSKG